MWAPKGTPKDVVAKLNVAINRALADPNVSKRLSDIGHDPFPADQTDTAGARRLSQGGD